MLNVEDVHTYFGGGIHALKGVSLTVERGEIVTLIGSNGAGKTTLLNTVCGLVRPKSGRVLFAGEDVTRTPAHLIVGRGLSHAPEGRRVFATLTVHENLMLGAYARRDAAAIRATLAEVLGYFPRLQERREQLAGTLSGGEQQMLAIGRALMAAPSLLLLDEPSLGLSPILVRSIFDIVRRINANGTTVLLVEQNARAALRLAHRAYVLESGSIVLSGRADDLLADARVRSAYFGATAKDPGAASVSQPSP
jgi:branched-chain amino acid transport system ATP-binding protein